MKTVNRITEYILLSSKQKKQEHLDLAKAYQLHGMPESAANEFHKAAEIHLKLSDKTKEQ